MQVCGGMRRREDREPGPWRYLARMLGVGRGEGTETSGLWQPGPGLLKVGPGITGFWGSQAGLLGLWVNIWQGRPRASLWILAGSGRGVLQAFLTGLVVLTLHEGLMSPPPRRQAWSVPQTWGPSLVLAALTPSWEPLRGSEPEVLRALLPGHTWSGTWDHVSHTRVSRGHTGTLGHTKIESHLLWGSSYEEPSPQPVTGSHSSRIAHTHPHTQNPTQTFPDPSTE